MIEPWRVFARQGQTEGHRGARVISRVIREDRLSWVIWMAMCVRNDSYIQYNKSPWPSVLHTQHAEPCWVYHVGFNTSKLFNSTENILVTSIFRMKVFKKSKFHSTWFCGTGFSLICVPSDYCHCELCLTGCMNYIWLQAFPSFIPWWMMPAFESQLATKVTLLQHSRSTSLSWRILILRTQVYISMKTCFVFCSLCNIYWPEVAARNS